MSFGGLVKIGRTTRPKARLRNYQLHNPFIRRFDMLVRVTPGTSERVEANLHVRYSAYRVQGEWFRLTEVLLQRLYEDLTKVSKAAG